MEVDTPSSLPPTSPPVPQSFYLYGPPEVSDLISPHLSTLPPPENVPKDHPFPTLMNAFFNDEGAPLMGKTEKNSATYVYSGNPCVDFFFQVVPDTPPARTASLLTVAWAWDPLTALKLVCHLRGVRGTGKSDKEGFYAAALWLHEHHPKTLSLNARCFAEFGYLKDLLEILFRLVCRSDARTERKKKKKGSARGHLQSRIPFLSNSYNYDYSCVDYDDLETGTKANHKKSKIDDWIEVKLKKIKVEGVKQWMQEAMANVTIDPEKEAPTGRKMRKQVKSAQRLRMARYESTIRGILHYTGDPMYRFLHDRVADLFAELLTSDLQHLRSNELRKIGLAAKWCPSPDSSFDRSTLLCESVARRLFPVGSDPSYAGIDLRHHAYHARTRLRQEVLVPLRKALQIPEVYMSAKDWGALPYNRVPSVAMKNYKGLFLRHDEERFKAYLQKVRERKATIAAGALLPHEILGQFYRGKDDQVAELQWEKMVRDMTAKGKLRNCLAVCDVSGSMSGLPMEVCIAMGMLLSELSEEPWNGCVISFSQLPQLHRIEGATLREKMSFMERLEWGFKTDFQQVFDRILRIAVDGKLPEEQMIKKVFVFSDMEFDKASLNPWETDYMVIKRKFAAHGYGSAVPQIVFWNLRDSRSTPVTAKQEGVALVSGFSKNLMKLFLERDGEFTPEEIMWAAISGKEYQQLVVFD